MRFNLMCLGANHRANFNLETGKASYVVTEMNDSDWSLSTFFSHQCSLYVRPDPIRSDPLRSDPIQFNPIQPDQLCPIQPLCWMGPIHTLIQVTSDTGSLFVVQIAIIWYKIHPASQPDYTYRDGNPKAGLSGRWSDLAKRSGTVRLYVDHRLSVCFCEFGPHFRRPCFEGDDLKTHDWIIKGSW